MSGKCTISFIIPACNSEKTIEACLSSLLAQKGNHLIEIIVVNDGSTDLTEELVRRFPVRYLKIPQTGAGVARNMGIAHAKGEFLAFVDSDVVLEETWLEQGLLGMHLPWIDVVQGPNCPAGLKNSFMLGYRLFRIHVQTGGTFNYLSVADKALPQLNTAAVLMRKRLFSHVAFKKDLLRCEDTDLSLQIFHSGAHYRTMSEMKSKVYDLRSPLGYLRRSWMTGQYLKIVSQIWGIELGCLPALPQEAPWSLKFFERLNRIATRLGSCFALTPYQAKAPKFRPIKKNSFLIHESIGTLSPYVRLVFLEEATVIYSPSPWAKIILKNEANALFCEICEGRQAPLLSEEKKLLEELFVRNILTASGAQG